MIRVDVQQSDAFDRLADRMPGVSIEARNAAAETAVGQLQDHFARLNSTPNKKGWPKRFFWNAVALTIGTNLTDQAAEISVASPAFWRRWKGGPPIRPKTVKNLAIPAIAEAYAAGTPGAGRVPVELMLLFRKRRPIALAEAVQQPRKGPEKGVRKVPGRIWYWLVKSVNPGPDPLAAPDFAEIGAACQKTADAYVAAIIKQHNARPTNA